MNDRFAQMLLSQGLLERSQLGMLRQRAKLLGGELDRHLIEMGLLGVEKVIEIYAESIALRAASPLDLDSLEHSSSSAFPQRLAARWRFIPMRQNGLLWEVLTDRSATPDLHMEVERTLGLKVSLLGIPPFLYEILWAWLQQQSQDSDLALLTARLYPRFIARLKTGRSQSETNDDPSVKNVLSLSLKLAQCRQADGCLVEVKTHLEKQYAQTAVWRVSGEALFRCGGDKTALTISQLEGLSTWLEHHSAKVINPVPKTWCSLLGDSIRDQKSLVIRPVGIAKKRIVALLVLGSEHLVLNERTRADLDDIGRSLSSALEQQLRERSAS
jgi:hypothetical protein